MKDLPAETPIFFDGLNDLIDRKRYRGLALRPPRRLLQLVHLAREHAAAVAYRPISFGNRGYLEERVADLHQIGSAIKDLLPRLKPVWRIIAGHVSQLLANISSDQKKKAFDRIVQDCDRTKYKEYWFHEITYVPASDRPLLTGPYDRILMVIGPGIGLGDEISCVELILSLRMKFPKAEFDFFGYYSGVWTQADSTFKTHSLVKRPMMAFECVDQVMVDENRYNLLVVYINFTGLCFHLAFCLDRIRPDIVEIAVGQGKMWFMPRDGSPFQVVHAMDPLYPENYGALRQISNRLVGPVTGSVNKTGKICSTEEFRIIISPLTSKPIFLTPADWADIIEKTLCHVTNRKPVSCLVLPGMSASSADYARELVDRTTVKNISEFNIRVLGSGGPLSSETAYSKVYHALNQAHLLVGIDTYTSHLAAMVSVASINLCYERNIAFWPDVSNSWWIELRHDMETITEVSTLLFKLAGGMKNIDLSMLKKSPHLDVLIKMDRSFSSVNGVFTHDDLQNILTTCHAAWNQIPQPYQRLITGIDANYAWPRICTWLSDDRVDDNARIWMLSVLSKSHFRKFCTMIGLLNHHFQSSTI
ncbi:MAG: hypothetical protein WA151_18620 [Desulfatirhabdiaceae bacterium]